MLRIAYVVAIALCTWCLLACTPRYDWREMHDADAGYRVMYPGKPTQDMREVTLSGEQLPMRMQAVRVDTALFSVGVVTLPRDDDQLRASVLTDLQRGLLANIGQVQAVPNIVAIKQANNAPSVAGIAIQARGQVSDRTGRFFSARFVARGVHVYQIVILAEVPPAQDHMDQFFASFVLE